MSSQEYFTDPIKQDEDWHDNDLEKMDQLHLAAQYKPDSEAEKALVRKIDRGLSLPFGHSTLYHISTEPMSGRSPLPLRGFSLNKRCGSNANTGGLEADLNLTSTQYSIVLLVSRFQTCPRSLVIKSNIYKVFSFPMSYSKFHPT